MPTFKRRRYTRTGKIAFAVAIELLEIVGFVIGFYAVVALPKNSMETDLTKLDKNSWETSMKFVQDELRILVDSAIESRTLGFVAMVFIVVAFFLRTILSRVIGMPSEK